MNLLYFTDSDVSTNKGGVNRVVHFLSRKFMEIPDWECHLAYLHESKVLPVSSFHGKLHVPPGHPEQAVKEYLHQHQIRIILINLVVKKNIQFILPLFNRLRQDNPSLKVVFCYHTYPGAEVFGISFQRGCHYLTHRPQPLSTLKEMFLYIAHHTPLNKIIRWMLKPKYRFIYENCDLLVLLSAYNIPRFTSLAGCKDPQRIRIIPNPLSLPENYPVEQLKEKKKEVLIVARLWEPVKRLSLALKIWKAVEESRKYPDWKLIILGNGDDENYYKSLTRKLKLQQVSFEGRQEPLEYYRRASLFMMTSLYEGFPLTLLESLQMGVVPIAFDAFESVHDIIENGRNGIIIPEKNIDLYAQRLMQLMEDAPLREKLAIQAIHDCQKYNMDKIIRMWCELFNTLSV